jgi:uncharacterized membrane protein
MYNIQKTAFTLLGITFFAFLPFFTVDAGLVPCGNSENDTPCTICCLAFGISNIIDLLMKILGILAVVVIVVAGILYMVSAGNQSMVSLAKAALKNTIIGVIIALTAFVMIHFILKAIAEGDTADTDPVLLQGRGLWHFNCGGTGYSDGCGGSVDM